MKIAIQNSWPNLSVSAEREFIARFVKAGRALGWTVKDVVTSDEIMAFEPDAVITTHEFTPKLTRFPTLGLIWSPVAFFGAEPDRIRNILSYDGYLVATQSLRDHVEALLAEHGKSAPVSTFDFLPTALRDVMATSDTNEMSLFYAGVHWDGGRHDSLFSELKGRLPLAIYGEPSKWKSAGADYRGTLPFDGQSVAAAIARCGIALSLHSPSHRREGIPSMRLFEAASAGAVIISDRIDFAQRAFGDSLLYVDPEAGAAAVADQIVAHVDWVRAHPEEAQGLARRAQHIFHERFTLEAQLAQVPDFVESVLASMAHRGEPDHGLVEVIVRIGSRPVEMVRRALQSVADQTYPRIGILLVSFREVPGLDSLLVELAPRFEHIRRISVPDNGLRSTSLWAGLKAAGGEFLANLDDDDDIHPTHVASQVSCLVHHRPEPLLVYSGVIEVQEEPGHWFDAINHAGDLGAVIKERRRLRFLEPFSRDRMLRLDNFIQSNAWMIRTSALTEDILIDPKTRVAEDMLFYLPLMDRGPFVPTWRATADWNWRSTSKNNSMFEAESWSADHDVLLRRLADFGIHPLLPGAAAETEAEAIPAPYPAPEHRPPRGSEPPPRLTLKRLFRKPSILLGPLAPQWRQFKAARRADRNQHNDRLPNLPSHGTAQRALEGRTQPEPLSGQPKGRTIKRSFKKAVNSLGLYVSSMKSQRRREELLKERDALFLERNLLAGERYRLVAEKDALSIERDNLAGERDVIAAERNALTADRDQLAARLSDLQSERDLLVDERNELAADRDGLAARLSDLQSERDLLVDERNELAADRDGLAVRLSALQSEQDLVIGERNASYREARALREEIDAIIADTDYIFGALLGENSRSSRQAQLNQDVLALIVNRFKTGGFFVEFGATNGIDLSNTYLLEKEFGWTGILAEPATIWQEDLQMNRNCRIEANCVWSESGVTLDFDMVSDGEFSTLSRFSQSDQHAKLREKKSTYPVQTISLLDLLSKHEAPKQIDYLSIDTEGSEYEILKGFDFGAYQFSFISVEHNYTQSRAKLKTLLEANGYRRICESLSRWDDWYLFIG